VINNLSQDNTFRDDYLSSHLLYYLTTTHQPSSYANESMNKFFNGFVFSTTQISNLFALAMSAIFRSNGGGNAKKRSRLSSASSASTALSHPSAAPNLTSLASTASSSLQTKHRQLKIKFNELVLKAVCFFMTSLLMSTSVYPHNLLLCVCYIRILMRC